MPVDLARRRLAQARVGVLGTAGMDGRPHLVPCCFVLRGDTVYSTVDAKPKTTLALRRLDNLRANPRVSLLVHHDSEDWSELWWVRADGAGRVVEGAQERSLALECLADKYRQYVSAPPLGAVIAIDVERWRSWP